MPFSIGGAHVYCSTFLKGGINSIVIKVVFFVFPNFDVLLLVNKKQIHFCLVHDAILFAESLYCVPQKCPILRHIWSNGNTNDELLI